MIASAVAAYIRENGLSAEQLARRAGMPPDRLAALLAGEGEMSIDEYLSVCSALGLDYSYFFDRAGDRATV